jgi:hypothetical protein
VGINTTPQKIQASIEAPLPDDPELRAMAFSRFAAAWSHLTSTLETIMEDVRAGQYQTSNGSSNTTVTYGPQSNLVGKRGPDLKPRRKRGKKKR